MRLAVFVALALLVAAAQHALLSVWWWAPDVGLALAAWAMVDGDREGMPLRAMLAGAARDLAEPGGWGFHLLVYLGLALALLPVRDLLFRSRWTAWAIWAFIAFAIQVAVEILVSGTVGERTWRMAWVPALGTAAAAVGLGWLLGGLPPRWRPVPVAGA